MPGANVAPWAGRLLDGVVVVVLLAVGAHLWALGRTPGPEWPWWAGEGALYLVGPDAGAWGLAIQDLAGPDPGHLDPRRLPGWLLLSALAFRWTGDAALAGHLVNRVLFLLLPLVFFAIGRIRGDRLAGVAGAGLALVNPLFQADANAFGVDMAVATLGPLALLAAAVVQGRAPVALLAGMVATYAALTHHTLLLLPVVFLPLLTADAAPGWPRCRVLCLYAAPVVGSVLLLVQVFHLQAYFEVRQVVAGGLASTQGTGVATPDATWAAMAQTLGRRLPEALATVLGRLPGYLGPAGAGPAVALALVLLGIPGRGRARHLSGGRRLWGDLAFGLTLLLLACPIVVLAAARAPERYADNFVPYVLLLMARGASNVVTLVGQVADRWTAGRATPALRLVAGLAAGALSWGHAVRNVPAQERIPPDLRELRLLSRELGTLAPPDAVAVCASWEILAYAGLPTCGMPVCARKLDAPSLTDCLESIRRTCAAGRPLVWVTARGPSIPQWEPQLEALGPHIEREVPATTLIGRDVQLGVAVLPPPEPSHRPPAASR